jgi:dGTPase
VSSNEQLTDVKRHRVIRRLINAVVTDLLSESTRRIQAMLKQRAGAAIADDVRRWPELLIGYPPETEQMNQELKSFLYERVYFHPRVLRMAEKAERVVGDLFEAYVQEPSLLSEGARQRLESAPLSRVVCDYIAGMTDRFALAEHARLCNPHERA